MERHAARGVVSRAAPTRGAGTTGSAGSGSSTGGAPDRTADAAHGALPGAIALCHEWITTFGGSEQVAQRIADALGIRDVFTWVADPDLAGSLFLGRSVEAIGRWRDSGIARKHWQWLLPFMPRDWAAVDLEPYDVVITSSHACVNSIRVRPGAHHISYCHTPMRYAWEWTSELQRFPEPLRRLWPGIAASLRRADHRRAQRVSSFIANSHHVAARIEAYYGRRAAVIHPPVDIDFWTPATAAKRDFFLFAGRLVAYKRADVAVHAAGLAGVPLVVAGSGPQLPFLKKTAGPGVEFIENPSKQELRALYRQAKALVAPGVEDFGMTLVEAQACGTPVLALRRGGALEAVAHGRTGELYDDPAIPAVAERMRRFDPDLYPVPNLRRHAERFDPLVFDDAMRRLVAAVAAGGSVGVPAAQKLERGPHQDLEVERN